MTECLIWTWLIKNLQGLAIVRACHRKTAGPAESITSISHIYTRLSNTLTYAALRIASTVHSGVMHATLPGQHLNFCRSRSLALRTRVGHSGAFPPRCVVHISLRIACAHRPETDRPAWKERTDQARSAILMLATTPVW